MNSVPMILRFSSGSTTPASLVRKRSCACDVHQWHVEMADEGVFHFLALALAHEPVVHEDAGQLISDGLVGEQRRNGGIHPAGEPADHAPAAHLRPDTFHRFLDDGHRGPGGSYVADAVEEVLEDVLAVLGVTDLRVELHPVEPADRVFHGRHRQLGAARRHVEARRGLENRVPVAHPHRLLRGEVLEQPARGHHAHPSARHTRTGPLWPHGRRRVWPGVGRRSRCPAPGRPVPAPLGPPWAPRARSHSAAHRRG